MQQCCRSIIKFTHILNIKADVPPHQDDRMQSRTSAQKNSWVILIKIILTLKSGIMKLQQRIIMARQQKGFTQEELATLTRLSIRTIQRIESGESIPRSFTLKAIAKALDQPYEQLMRDETAVLSTPASGQNETIRHFLPLFNLSCFSYIVIPWVHFLIPILPAFLKGKKTMLYFDSGSSAYELLTNKETAALLALPGATPLTYPVTSWGKILTATSFASGDSIEIASIKMPLNRVTYIEGILKRDPDQSIISASVVKEGGGRPSAIKNYGEGRILIDRLTVFERILQQFKR